MSSIDSISNIIIIISRNNSVILSCNIMYIINCISNA